MIEVSRREWAEDVPDDKICGKPGFLYDVRLVARHRRVFDYASFLTTTERVHPSTCHICLEGGNDQVRITIPSILGAAAIIDMVTTLVTAAEYALRPGMRATTSRAVMDGSAEDERVDELANQQPEYVLGPANPLTFLWPDMPCSFFEVD